MNSSVNVRVSEELEKLEKSKFCGCIIETEHILYVDVLPHEKENLILHVLRKLSDKIGLYDSVLRGVVLSARNISILNNAELIVGGPARLIHIKAMFEIYQPKINSKTVFEIKKVLVPCRVYQAVLLGVCDVVVKLTSPIMLQEDSSVPFVIMDFKFDCENPFFICRPLESNSSTDNQ